MDGIYRKPSNHWGSLSFCSAVVMIFVTILGKASAQSPARVPENLKFTQEISQRFHVVAWVTLEDPDGSEEKYQYDLYPITGQDPGMERIKRSEGVFVRPFGGQWLHTDDDNEETPVEKHVKDVLDTDVMVVGACFGPATGHDKAQGGTVWKSIGSKKHDSITTYSFEKGREHPKPNVTYPIYTFMKAPGDKDGRLFLCSFSANLRDENGIVPVSMRMTYLIPVPPGTKLQVFDKDTGKEKLSTTTGADSGWEISTKASEPPSTQ
jgi:hypothetical protein